MCVMYVARITINAHTPTHTHTQTERNEDEGRVCVINTLQREGTEMRERAGEDLLLGIFDGS